MKAKESLKPVVVRQTRESFTRVLPATVVKQKATAGVSDLKRVKGIGDTYGHLLHSAGVQSVEHLSDCQAEVLHRVLQEFNAAHQLANRTPSLPVVQVWIKDAKQVRVPEGMHLPAGSSDASEAAPTANDPVEKIVDEIIASLPDDDIPAVDRDRLLEM